ncbi:MAG: hypothetical protein HGB02_02060 [Chlorobiaceae bacterium]|nr:hypothetical protein [Chlorobiaceae bacterium]
MKARKKSVTRDLLRIFEIALFFAISVLGYGMLAKTSTSGSKTKSRTQLSDTRNTLIPDSFERALRDLRVLDAAPAKTRLDSENPQQDCFLSALEAPVHIEHRKLHLLPADLDRGPAYGFASSPPSIPYNLLQQNPVLLV